MAKFVVYAVNGAILRAGECPDADVSLQTMGDGSVLQVADGPPSARTHYVAGGALVPRPAITPSTVPTGADAVIVNMATGETFSCVVDEEGLEIDLPGSWHVTVTPPWPFQVLTYETVVAD